MVTLRRLIRRTVPAQIRVRVRELRREIRDRQSHIRFPTVRGDPREFTRKVCSYERPLMCYVGQEPQFPDKRQNVAVALSRVDRLVVRPGETFSFWRCVGRPSRKHGYRPAAALKEGRLVDDIGGAICLASTVLYNAGLLSGMAIAERWCHSVDSYGERRYFELGRDAAVEYPYRDLRLQNGVGVSLLLRARAERSLVVAEVWAHSALQLSIRIHVDAPRLVEPRVISTVDKTLPVGTRVVDAPGTSGVWVHTRRSVALAGQTQLEDLGWSIHHAQSRLERHAPGGQF